MRPTAPKRGILQFGTEVITSKDGTIVGLLGASRGASTATAIMADVLKRCLPNEYPDWIPRLEEMLPYINIELASVPQLFEEIRNSSDSVLLSSKSVAG